MNDVDQVKTSKKARHKEAGGRAKQNGLTSVLSEVSRVTLMKKQENILNYLLCI